MRLTVLEYGEAMESLVVFVEDPKHHRGPWPMLKAPEVSRHQKILTMAFRARCSNRDSIY
jgi:hypothetical protein